MRTLRLKIDDKVFDRLVWLLNKFGKDEIEIISEDIEFLENQKYLESELKDILSGQATFSDISHVEQRLESTIKKNEGSL